MSKKLIVVLVLAVGAVAAIPKVREILHLITVDVPRTVARPPKSVHLPQNWTAEQESEFHHLAQGTRLLPYAWFKALEQPCFSLRECDDFADLPYLERFGFIPSPGNADGLPIGFARHKNFHDPNLNENYEVLGLTCAACHTGELFYNEYAIRIEGGPAMVELAAFQKALGLAMLFTAKVPGRWERFEKRVGGENLKVRFDKFLADALREKDYVTKHGIYDNASGFGRTDALTRIGNQVFAVDLNKFENFRVSNASVRFPQIWDAPWLDWVQYNSSIADPLVRNIGEALGVRAMLNPENLDNSIDVPALMRLETLLAGPEPFQGLTSPKWPDVFPKLDGPRVQRGEALYKQYCQGCHLAPVPELMADRMSPDSRFWIRTSPERPLIRVVNIGIEQIGTDPRAARDYRDRRADSGALGKGELTAAQGLDLVTVAIADRALGKNRQSGYGDGQRVRDDLIYKARPLNGIWAAAPYLHNGSVPNLYLLLSPPSERPSKFWMGDKNFNTKEVGYFTAEKQGLFQYDTSKPGNSNTGHEFTDGPAGKGVIGPRLTVEQRWDLVEYLKSL